MKMITLTQAQDIVAAALADGRARGLKPLTVAVVDSGGHVIAVAREDGASNLRPQMAIAKASGALALGMSSRAIGEMAVDRQNLVLLAAGLNPAGILPAAGGVLIQHDGLSIGAVGVTGDTSDNDELVAFAGIAAAGLSAQ